ncbi:uncharacterized protein LOC112136329 isoform X1 [Oryzias melastigma]|uniref:uncharacterized protein LOC112136329 isoform X1 n=1 Tax=Oryzias melastigma TaxID=30732 RepID=UPI000CF7EB74|nr:uncharacterized protein LOC112136329 isoform X1 [Oryzias melastigma]XP_024113719.1 uncharacterized protein LOC112136329 isoform X1 [Oryzias melastigma]
MRRKELKHADMRRGDALLSVLEFYILMKEEARQPIREAGAGADHRGSDSRGVRGRLGGPPARPAARRPRVSWWQVVRPSGQDKSPLLWLWSPPPPPPVLTVLGCSYRCCTTAEDSERSGREEGQTGLIPTTTSSRGAARCRAESVPPGEGSPKWNALVLPPSERHLLTRCGGTAGVVNQAATVQGPATSQHQGLIAAAHAADLTGSDDIPSFGS